MRRIDPFGEPPIDSAEILRALRIVGPQHIGCGRDGTPRKADCRRAVAAWDWAVGEARRRTVEAN